LPTKEGKKNHFPRRGKAKRRGGRHSYFFLLPSTSFILKERVKGGGKGAVFAIFLFFRGKEKEGGEIKEVRIVRLF